MELFVVENIGGFIEFEEIQILELSFFQNINVDISGKCMIILETDLLNPNLELEMVGHYPILT